MKPTWLSAAFAGTLALGMSLAAQAAEYPTRPIKVIVPFAPGGSTDLVARMIEKVAPKYLGQPLVIENRPGAGGMLGWSETVNAKPDGYTITVCNSAIIPQSIYGISRFDFTTSLEAIAQIGEIPYVWVVRADAPWTGVDDFVAYAKAHPGEIKYGITGVGNTSHLGPKALEMTAGLKMADVNFDGGAPLIAALLGGHIQAASNNPVDIKEQLKAGRLRVIGVFGEKRLDDPLLKDAPTFKERGFDAVSMLWQGVCAPKNIPADARAKLGAGFGAMLQDPAVRKTTEDLGLVPAFLGPDAFAAKWKNEMGWMSQLVTDTGILAAIRSQTR